jgi:hypothetical protein
MPIHAPRRLLLYTAGTQGENVAKPNYRFDKRQRELRNKQKQEEKRLKKLARNAAEPAAESGLPAESKEKS